MFLGVSWYRSFHPEKEKQEGIILPFGVMAIFRTVDVIGKVKCLSQETSSVFKVKMLWASVIGALELPFPSPQSPANSPFFKKNYFI